MLVWPLEDQPHFQGHVWDLEKVMGRALTKWIGWDYKFA